MNVGNLFSPEPANAWMKQAACSGIFTELFFYTTTNPRAGNKKDVVYALTVCARCPVKAPCLEYALRTHDNYAILGGTTPRQRQQIRKERARAEFVG